MNDVAVIIPVYNGGETLSSSVSSVQKAGKRVSEIIIVDDGSTDNTLLVAKKLAKKDKRVKIIHKKNHGSYSARQTGIAASISSYIAFLDVDDRYMPNAIDILADLLEQYNADVAMGSYVKVTSGDSPIIQKESTVRVIEATQMWPRIMKWKTQEFVSYVWNKLYKRELLLNMIKADGINQGDDVLITCQVFINVNKLVETTAPVYMYYQNPNSLTRAGFGKGDLNLIRVWNYIIGIMKKERPDLLYMAEFNRWRTDFTLIMRIILMDDQSTDKKYAAELKKRRAGLKRHWKDLITPHAMPKNRELLIIGLRFFFTPTKVMIRLGCKLANKEPGEILHNGEKI